MPKVSARTASRAFGALAVLAAVAAAVALLAPRPLADAFFAGWVALGVAVSAVGGAAAWTNRTPPAWAAALLLAALAVAGTMSIGYLFAPAALLLLGAALLSHAAGPRPEVREAVVADPPTVPEAVGKTLGGVGAAVLGGALVYAGAFRRDLFGACASETLACVVDTTHWDAVAVTALGLVAAGLGAWSLWTQVYAARVLAAVE